MRRLALLGLCAFTLSGCAFKDWSGVPFISGPDPYAPAGASENMLRALGERVSVAPLKPETGNMWPGPLPPTPTLEDLQKQGGEGGLSPLQTLPGQPPAPPPPLPNATGPLGPLNPVVPKVPPLPSVGTPPAAAPQTSGVVQTPQGPAVTSGGTGAFKTITLPNGMTGIVVPNGNGTSTVILGNGQVQTIPTPK